MHSRLLILAIFTAAFSQAGATEIVQGRHAHSSPLVRFETDNSAWLVGESVSTSTLPRPPKADLRLSVRLSGDVQAAALSNPKPAASERSGKSVKAFFRNGSSRLLGSDKFSLLREVSALADKADPLKVNGFDCDPGFGEANSDLGLKRAKAAADVLFLAGYKTVLSNTSTSECSAKNPSQRATERRVEISLLNSQSKFQKEGEEHEKSEQNNQ